MSFQRGRKKSEYFRLAEFLCSFLQNNVVEQHNISLADLILFLPFDSICSPVFRKMHHEKGSCSHKSLKVAAFQCKTNSAHEASFMRSWGWNCCEKLIILTIISNNKQISSLYKSSANFEKTTNFAHFLKLFELNFYRNKLRLITCNIYEINKYFI